MCYLYALMCLCLLPVFGPVLHRQGFYFISYGINRERQMAQEDVRQKTGSEAELIDYLSKNLVESKIHVNDLRQSRNQLIFVVILLVMFAILCVGGFASVVYLINQENARTIQSVFDSCYEKSVETEEGVAKVVQDAGDSGNNNAVVNNKSTITGSNIHANSMPNK